jgi:hypothetical protein
MSLKYSFIRKTKIYSGKSFDFSTKDGKHHSKLFSQKIKRKGQEHG